MVTKKKKTSSKMPDWCQLPGELLHIISKKLEDHCFDVIHARSVCSYWRSTFPFPCCLLRKTYSLPSLPHFNNDGLLCTLEKLPFFLFRVHTLPIAALCPSEFFLGGIVVQDESEDEFPSDSCQCSVKVKITGSDPVLMNMLDCQILSLGHQYRMTGWDHKYYRKVALLPLNKHGGREEFVVILICSYGMFVLTSVEMKWKLLDNVDVPNDACISLVAFKDRFVATFSKGGIVVINPYLLIVTPLFDTVDDDVMFPFHPMSFLVPSGSDELLLVTLGHPCRVSRLDVEAEKWVKVNDLEDRVLFTGHLGNFSFSAMELPHRCGVSGNSILFISESSVDLFYKSVIIGAESTDEDLDSCWTLVRENRMTILTSSSVLALRFACVL